MKPNYEIIKFQTLEDLIAHLKKESVRYILDEFKNKWDNYKAIEIFIDDYKHYDIIRKLKENYEKR